MKPAELDAEHSRIARAVADGWTALGLPTTKAGSLSAVVMLAVLSARENFAGVVHFLCGLAAAAKELGR